jgi:iron complex outermembrane receptor protein
MKTLQKKLLLLLLILPLGLLAQNTLKGVVLDGSSKQTLPGVNVLVAGTTNGATTDFDGNFTLTNIKKGDRIVFSYIGFKDETITYENQNTITITLQEDQKELKDVIVIGYGTTTKKDATGSVTSVTSKEFNKGAIVSADQLLTGKAPGVRITNNGGQPDSAPNIRIRGGSSLNANSSPLLVIDGVPVDNTTPAGVSNPLSLINPNDIESFTILKDASATAIYGSRASNGVIIITTKKGSKGSPEFNYSSSVSFGNVSKKINVMDGKTFSKFIQEYHPDLVNNLGIADPNAPIGTVDDPSTPDVIEGRILANTDWQDAIFRNSISTDHNISGRANLFGYLPFRASLGYTRNEGIVKTNDYERYSYSIKMNPNMFDNHLKLDVNAKGIITDKNAIDEGSALAGAVNMDPTKPIYDSNSIFGGYYQTMTASNPNVVSGQYNPVALLEQRSRPERSIRFLGNIEMDYKMHFLPELRAVVNLGLDASESKIRETFTDNAIATYNGTNVVFNPGKNYQENQTITNTTFDSYLVYTKNMNGLLKKFDIQGGYSYQNFKNDGNKEIYQYNPNTGIREILINPNNPNNRYYNELNLQSFFGRTNLDFANKYLLTLSFRADGSSLFREKDRWGFFPAAALAWKLKEEDFLKNVTFVNDLKLRLSAGKTGQQDITGNVGFYPSIPLFSIGSTTSQYLPGSNLYSALPFNENLTWEKTSTVNAGLDFNFFKNSLISGAFDIYYNKTSDLLARVPTAPGQYLSDSFITNVGKTEGKGFELNLNIKPISNDNSTLEFYSNIAYNSVEVTDLGDVERLNAGGGLPVGTNVNSQVNAVGFQPYAFWLFQQLYDTDGNVIPGAFVDRNGDGQITNDDRYYVERTPKWTFGFGFNYNYKNWDFGTSFRGQFGGQTYNSRILTSGWIDATRPTNSSSLSNVLDFYSGEASTSFINFNGNEKFSDYMVEDATFLRCENIVLGYRFNKFYKDASLRLYGAVNNAFLVTKYGGQDPENFGGIDNNFYPRPRVYTVGLSLDF